MRRKLAQNIQNAREQHLGRNNVNDEGGSKKKGKNNKIIAGTRGDWITLDDIWDWENIIPSNVIDAFEEEHYDLLARRNLGLNELLRIRRTVVDAINRALEHDKMRFVIRGIAVRTAVDSLIMEERERIRESRTQPVQRGVSVQRGVFDLGTDSGGLKKTKEKSKAIAVHFPIDTHYDNSSKRLRFVRKFGEPIKRQHKTKNEYRYRISEANPKMKHYVKKIDGVNVIFEYA